VSPLGDKDVSRLDIAVNDALAVSGVKRVGDLQGKFENSLEVERRTAKQLPQRIPLQALHCDKHAALLFPHFVDRAAIRMIQRRGGPRLAMEALVGMRIMGKVVR